MRRTNPSSPNARPGAIPCRPDDLLRENERLRAAVERLHRDQERLRGVEALVPELERENDALRQRLTAIEVECCDLSKRLVAARAAMPTARPSAAQSHLPHGPSVERLAAQVLELEQRNASLTYLYVASSRLAGAFERSQVLESIHEIVINLVGSEEFAIYRVEPRDERLEMVSCFGLPPGPYRALPLGVGFIGTTAVTGEPFYATHTPIPEATPQERNLSASVPLRAADRVIGVLAVFRLLPQKPAFEPLDRELFDLIGAQGGTALYAAEILGRVAPTAVS